MSAAFSFSTVARFLDCKAVHVIAPHLCKGVLRAHVRTRPGERGREKDGLWAVLAWLSILAHRNVPHEDLGAKLAKLAPGAPHLAPMRLATAWC